MKLLYECEHPKIITNKPQTQNNVKLTNKLAKLINVISDSFDLSNGIKPTSTPMYKNIKHRITNKILK